MNRLDNLEVGADDSVTALTVRPVGSAACPWIGSIAAFLGCYHSAVEGRRSPELPECQTRQRLLETWQEGESKQWLSR